MEEDWSFRRSFWPCPAFYENRPTRRMIPMIQKRHTLLLALTALLLAGGPAPQTASPFPELFDQASDTYEKGDWTHRGSQFPAPPKAAPFHRQAPRAFSGAAPRHAR